MPPIRPISLLDIIRPATVGAMLAGLIVVVVLAVLAFRANAATGQGIGESNATVILMIAAIMVGVIGIPLAVSVTYAVTSLRAGETMEVMEVGEQQQAQA